MLKTVAYADVFDYPLTAKEIKQWLIKGESFTKDSPYWNYLPGRKNLIFLRRRRERFSRLKWPMAYRTAKILSLIPWVKLVAVTGALAMNNADKNDDIDLMIITAKNRLWLTRLLASILLFFHLRRGQKIYNKLCLNLWLDETALVIKPQNLYIAHDILLMQPIINKRDYYFKFMRANDWVFKYFANFPIDLPLIFRNKRVIRGRFLDFIEWLAMKMQLYYMKRRKTTEVVEKGIIHFNKNDCTNRVLSTYGKILEGYGIK